MGLECVVKVAQRRLHPDFLVTSITPNAKKNHVEVYHARQSTNLGTILFFRSITSHVVTVDSHITRRYSYKRI